VFIDRFDGFQRHWRDGRSAVATFGIHGGVRQDDEPAACRRVLGALSLTPCKNAAYPLSSQAVIRQLAFREVVLIREKSRYRGLK
jgi:hypothetical protein